MSGLGFVYQVTLLSDDDNDGRFYIGKKDRIYEHTHPSQLWDCYFTTNEVVHELIDRYGIGAFATTVLFTSTKPDDIVQAYDAELSKYPHVGYCLGVHKCINTETATTDDIQCEPTQQVADNIDLDAINKDLCSPTELLALVRAGRL